MPEQRGGGVAAALAQRETAGTVATLAALRRAKAKRGAALPGAGSPPEDPLSSAPVPAPPDASPPAGESAAASQPMPVEAAPDDSPRTGSRNLGLIVSGIVHFCAVIGLSLLLAPLDLGPDEPLRLDVAVAASEEIADLVELDASFDAELTALELNSATALSHDMQGSLQSLSGVLGGGGFGQRGTFFGTVAYGNRFVYVLDVSGSMNRMRDPKYRLTRFKCAVDELLRSVDELTEDQFFYVVLFSYNMRPMFDDESLLPQPIPATAENKQRLRKWISQIRPGSGTDPRTALKLALTMEPSAVFLLSDGEFNGQKDRKNADVLHGNPSVEQVIEAHSHGGTPINTIAYEDPQTRYRMEAIAAQSGGKHQYVPPLKISGSK